MSFSCKLFILLGCISSVINATTTTTTAGGSTTTTAGGATTTTTAGRDTTTTSGGATTTTTSGVCADSSTNCATWASNGFCSNSFYTTAQKRQYCAKKCNLCSGSGNGSCSGCTDNAKCFTWVRNGFCSSLFYTTAQNGNIVRILVAYVLLDKLELKKFI